jgi:hypothetical protein
MHFTIDTYLGIAGIILGLVAIIMAVQSFFQMNWGRPKIKIGFDEGHEEGRKVWLGLVQNEPIMKNWLKKIGVHREPVVIRVTFKIFKSTNELAVQRTFVLLKSADGNRAEQIELRTPLPVPFVIAACQKDSTAIYAVNLKERTSTVLSPGQYVVHIEVLAEESMHEAKSSLIVGNTAGKTHWE